MLSYTDAKRQYPAELQLLQRVSTEDASLLKTNVAPGTMTVFQGASRHPNAETAGEDPIYIRGAKGDPKTGMVVLALSNGGVQIFAQGYELRWFNEERKFLVRSDGSCAVINDSTFTAMPDIERILSEPLLGSF